MADETGTPGDDVPPHPAEQPPGQPDRQAQPVDAEQPPRLPFPVVGVGASAGGLEAFGAFLDAMRADSGMAFVFVNHLPPTADSHLAEVLAHRTAMPVRPVEDGMPVESDHVYVIRPGHVLAIKDGRLHLGPPLGSARAANRPVDDFFKSLAEEQRERAIAVVMSGMGSNGTAGAQAVKAVGGLCVAQGPDSAQYPSMPRHLIDAGYADYVARPADLPEILLAYAGSPYASGGREADAQAVLEREQQHLREILAVLRTRAKQDFTGYKKPTLLRRVQRRMGLTRLPTMAEYARHFRQSAAEVTALADDVLIHVTGFFRDPEAWDALREKVIVPLVEAREPGGVVRAWTTACSSGEEAYSLAILLTEESDRAGKRLDVKVFATDLADRALAHARAGVYPGGIESEIPPERLARFFQKEDEAYRVRPDLRDKVVFAPQNVLQDPPFSRIDIVSCRNLLIYLEPPVQQRVLALLHFGLREGGALFLGASETVTGAEELFEPVDKRARIYRRVGPTWHGMTDFPVPRVFPADESPAAAPVPVAPRRPDPARAAVAEQARRTLLEWHTPAAVTIDRDYHILYYHGDTQPFLKQLTGEPTRDLMLLARDGVRGAVRVAIQRAAAANGPATVTDGWVEVDAGRRARVVVTASPFLDPGADRAAPPAHFVVSFGRAEDPAPPPPADLGGPPAAADLARLRAELQSTIEELQTSNEELKASHEEAMSVNEELQSANEELETSKEEMQSLNEELRTVNAQLRAKMEEHAAASSDLASLLTSTDIAVLFLDPALHIRRFTPAARDLVDLIPADVGRPLSALARRFDDPDLDADCRAVLDKLVPVAREVAGGGGRHYLRRVLPYRTVDSRIDGVVVTFVDITDRQRAEEALRAREEQFRRAIEDAPIPVIMQAEDGQVLQVSRTWTALTGYALTDVPTFETWLTRAYGPGADAVRDHTHELFDGHRASLEVDFAIRPRAGADRHWRFSASTPGTLADGRRFLVGMAVDVTDRKRAEAETPAAREYAESIVETLHEPVLVLHPDLTVRSVNPAFYEHFRVGPDGTIGRKVYALGNGQWDIPALRTLLEDVLPDSNAFNDYEVVHEFEGLGRRVMLVNARRLDHVQFILLGIRDVTAERKAGDALRRSEERLRLALAAAQMGIWTLDPDTGTQMRDANLNAMLGLDPAETTQPFDEFLGHIHPDDGPAVRGAFDASAREGRPLRLEFRVVWPDGTVRWLRDQGDVFGEAAAASRRMAGACVDVTERRAAEAALRASEERLRLIVESATDYAIFTLAPDRTVTSWSPGAAATFGWAEAEMVGRPGDDLFTPEDRQAGAPAKEADEARRGGRASDERWHLRKDGSRFYASGALTPLGDSGARGFVKVLRDLTDRKRLEDELRDARDMLEARVAKRTAELKAAQDRALRAARLAAIGEMVTGLAHESRNALQRAQGCLSVLQLRLKDQPAVLDLLARVQAAQDDLARHYEDVRQYAIPIRLDRRPTDLGAVWREAWADLESVRAGRAADLVEEAGGADLQIAGDPFRLKQVFRNLLENALAAAPDPARVTVRCSDADLGGRPAVRVAVADSGPGFDPAVRDRLFEPFQTTKVRGTGLGLAIVKRLVEAHNGKIEAGPAGGPGAEVILTLPREDP